MTGLRPRNKLTERELEIAKHLAEGKNSREIGEILKISHRTVSAHREMIYLKLGIVCIADLARWAVKNKHIEEWREE